MELKQSALYLLAAGMIATGGTAVATEQDQGFTALAHVETQALSSHEMQAISGQLNAGQIAAALSEEAAEARAAGLPRLAAALDAAAAKTLLNADQINARLQRLHLYTP